MINLKNILKAVIALMIISTINYASESAPTEEEVSKLYVATFNRAPDSTGLAYWVNDSGLSLSGIAKSFFVQTETQALYPEGTTVRAFIQSVYQNLFNRAPDSGGLSYWEDDFNLRGRTRDSFILAMINGAKDNADGMDKTILNHKNEVGLYFAHAGLTNVEEAKIIVQSISSDLETVTMAKSKIDNLSENEEDDSVSIAHDSVIYKIITSPITNKRWLDRNLGANKACTQSRDNGVFSTDMDYIADQRDCFGDLYQWGRLADGHEKASSTTSSLLAGDISNAGIQFITNDSSTSEWTNIDSDGTLREEQWTKTDGSSICPIGFRVPTSEELYAETINYSGNSNAQGAIKVSNRDTAFQNFLKLPVVGKRLAKDGSLDKEGAYGTLWTSTREGKYSATLEYWASSAKAYTLKRGEGFSVRCIEDASLPTDDDVSAPVFTSSNTVAVNENQTKAITVSVSDTSPVSYSLSGVDESAFSLDSSSGVVTFKVAPDYEVKNEYQITVTATDTSNNSTDMDITINILDVDETSEPTEVTHNSLTYKIVTSPITGKKWLDRNLGASEACSKSRDEQINGVQIFTSDEEYVTDQENCFGNLYQWGRLEDGHENIYSKISYIQATNVSNAGSLFIKHYAAVSEWTSVDTDGNLRRAQWNKTDGSTICPVGFRVPSSQELFAETSAYQGKTDYTTGKVAVTNRDTAFKNFLKFPVPGYRAPLTGELGNRGNYGGVWAISSGEKSLSLGFNLKTAVEFDASHAYGYSVRCIQDKSITAPDTDAPIFTSLNLIEVEEGKILAYTAIATDTSPVSYSLSGVDESAFSLDSSSGVVTFKVAPDYEVKNEYQITVTATDTSNNSTDMDITINILDVDETSEPTEVTHNSLTYKIVTSPITGKKWLDRNLGASEACSKSRDEQINGVQIFTSDEEYVTDQENCFGNLYQWGRLEDGHENIYSKISYIQATNVSNAGSLFIKHYAAVSEWTSVDTDGNLRRAQWNKTDGSTICPVGFRVPSSQELFAETSAYQGKTDYTTGKVAVTNRDTAFKNFLKFPVPGYRAPLTGELGNRGNYGGVWAISSGEKSLSLGFNSKTAVEFDASHAYGYSVRCIKN